MTKRIEYDPSAILYRWNFKEDDGKIRLIGTDPVLSDPTKFFRWIDEPRGWEGREPWLGGTATATRLEHKLGAHSGWSGAIPMSRPPGRPKKEVADDDRPVSVSTAVRRAELFEIMRRAADAKQTVAQWVAAVLREKLVGGAADGVHE